jgi:hypothetical protein
MPDRTRIPGRSQGPLTSDHHKYHPYQNQRPQTHGPYYGNYLVGESQHREPTIEKYPANKGKAALPHSAEIHLPTDSLETQKASLPRSSSPKPRSELVESPVSKSMYKNFFKSFKTKEGESFSEAITYAVNELANVPEQVRWRAYIDVADTLKRNSHYGDVSPLSPSSFSLSYLPRPVPIIAKSARNTHF